MFLEDTTGKGHKDHAVNDDELLLALIPVPDDEIVSDLIIAGDERNTRGAVLGRAGRPLRAGNPEF